MNERNHKGASGS